jgi:chromosome segregation ATPase
MGDYEYVDQPLFQPNKVLKKDMRDLRNYYTKAKAAVTKAEMDVKTKKAKWEREKRMNEMKENMNQTPDLVTQEKYEEEHKIAIDTRDEKRDVLRAKKISISDKVEELEKDIEEIMEKITEMMDVNTDYNETKDDLLNDIKQLKQDRKLLLKEDPEEDIDSIEENIEEKTDTIGEIEQWSKEAKADIEKGRAKIGKLKEEIEAAKSLIRPTRVILEEEEPSKDVKADNLESSDDSDSSDDDDSSDDEVDTVVHKAEPQFLVKILELIKKPDNGDKTKDALLMMLDAIKKQNEAVSRMLNNKKEADKITCLLEKAMDMLKK